MPPAVATLLTVCPSACFGSEFRSKRTSLLNGSEGLPAAVRAFLEIGNERNKLVHRNYATFAVHSCASCAARLFLGGGCAAISRERSLGALDWSAQRIIAVKTSSITRFVRQPELGSSWRRLSVQMGWETPAKETKPS